MVRSSEKQNDFEINQFEKIKLVYAKIVSERIILEGVLIFMGFSFIQIVVYQISKKAIQQFFDKNQLTHMIRGHEVEIEGYKQYQWGNKTFLTTLFSAANYCDVYDNYGAICILKQNKLEFRKYTAVEHPYVLPDYEDIFQFSIPFLMEKVNEILLALVGNSKEDQSSDEEQRKAAENNIQNCLAQTKRISLREKFRKKVSFLTKLLSMAKQNRQNQQDLILMGLSSSSKIPKEMIETKNLMIQEKKDQSSKYFQILKEQDKAEYASPKSLKNCRNNESYGWDNDEEEEEEEKEKEKTIYQNQNGAELEEKKIKLEITENQSQSS
eukprot:TRINITY_DN5714_c0_g1_i3.p1 TRINITY_DN5714_c0_g1~~TRINITY_DN5714_c0_g1_i3.p1  ORF type:complete len:325 (+),score=76.23 TRINITY_DN5714_c0_g1_i3:249-1223(+)